MVKTGNGLWNIEGWQWIHKVNMVKLGNGLWNIQGLSMGKNEVRNQYDLEGNDFLPMLMKNIF